MRTKYPGGGSAREAEGSPPLVTTAVSSAPAEAASGAPTSWRAIPRGHDGTPHVRFLGGA